MLDIDESSSEHSVDGTEVADCDDLDERSGPIGSELDSRNDSEGSLL